MQDTTRFLPRTNCPTCGKSVPKRDKRDTKPAYCDRKCAQMGRFKARYRGTNSGPFTRPVDLMSKMKWQGTQSSILGSDIPGVGTV